MNFLRSPRAKLLAATVAVLALALIAPMKGASASTVARAVLAVAAVAGMGWWFIKNKKAAFELSPAPRLRVLARAGLSQRCGMALVEADGDNYLVVFGDGFAELQQAKLKRSPKVQARRPRPTRRTPRATARKGGAL